MGGCGGDDDEPRRPGAATRAELQWVEAYADWSHDFLSEYERSAIRVGATRDPKHLEFALECVVGLREQVGPPPTRRLGQPWRLTAEACAFFRGWRENQIDVVGEDDPGEELFEAEANLQRASEHLELAQQALLRLVGDGRPIPVRRGPSGESHIAPPYGRAAAVVSHHEVEARCWSEDDWGEVVRVVAALDPEHYVDYAGLASPGEERVSLAPEVCDGLATLVYSESRPGEGAELHDVAFGVQTLAHEAVHVRAPGLSEAEVECAALQEVRRTARALGATRDYADRLAEFVWERIYPENSPEYFTRACRDGGPLDANPASPVWP
jgi:hypothetical protein